MPFPYPKIEETAMPFPYPTISSIVQYISVLLRSVSSHRQVFSIFYPYLYGLYSAILTKIWLFQVNSVDIKQLNTFIRN